MKPLVLESVNYRRLLLENAMYFLRSLWRYCYLFFKLLRNVVYLVLYVLFVPIKVYKMESPELPPREVNLKDEYQKHLYPPRSF